MSEVQEVINDKKIFSFNLTKTNITQLDLLRQEPVTRSELLDYLIDYLLKSPDFVSDCVKLIKEKTQHKLIASESIG